MKEDFDFYDLLNVDEDASQEEIRTAFREQVRNYHPDLNDDPRAPAQFSALKKAYDTLNDRKERDAYDRMGHDEYVDNRISGLPSPDAWITEEDSGSDDGPDGDAGDGRSEAAAGSADRSDTSRSTGGGSTTQASTGSTGRQSTSTRSTTESSSGSSGRSRSRSRSRNGDGAASSADGAAGTAETGERSGSVRNRTGGTGAGTARGPDTGTATEPDGETLDDDSTATDRESTGGRVWSDVESAFAATVGWPLIIAADALFLVSLGLYAAASSEGLNALLDRIAAAGADPGAIQSALGTRPPGFESLSSFVGAELTASPVTGMLVLVGMAFFPSVYFFMVRWTRKNRRPWQPSYLYVVGALSPIVALLASMLANVPGVYVEVVGFFLVPVGTIAAMLFFAQVKPRVARLYRRWRYRLGS